MSVQLPDAYGEQDQEVAQKRQELELRIEAKRRELEHDYFAVFSSESGKRVLGDLEEFCYAYGTLLAAVAGATNVDAMATAARIGRREVWCRIREKMHRAYMGTPVGGTA